MEHRAVREAVSSLCFLVWGKTACAGRPGRVIRAARGAYTKELVEEVLPLPRFTRAQRRIFLGCLIAYGGAYLSRYNIAVALPDILAKLSLTDAQGGVLTTVFAIVYAAGQFVNGNLVDRVNPRLYIAAGLAGSALCNVGMGLAPSYGWMIALWCLNGVVQSMLWTPVVKILSNWFFGRQRDQAVFGISVILVGGHLLSWILAGLLTSNMGWRWAFGVPGIATLAAGVAALCLLRNRPKEGEAPADDVQQAAYAEQGGTPMPISSLLFHTGLIFILACCVFNGLVRDSIMTWAPKMLMDLQGISLDSMLSVVLIIPVINLLGIFIGRIAYVKCHKQSRVAIGLLMGVCAVFCLLSLVFVGIHPLLTALLIGGCSALISSTNPLLTTMMPLEYDYAHRVGTVTGMVDCFMYVGSSVAGVLTGFLSGRSGWNSVIGMWMALALVGMALIFAAQWQRRRSM